MLGALTLTKSGIKPGIDRKPWLLALKGQGGKRYWLQRANVDSRPAGRHTPQSAGRHTAAIAGRSTHRDSKWAWRGAGTRGHWPCRLAGGGVAGLLLGGVSSQSSGGAITAISPKKKAWTPSFRALASSGSQTSTSVCCCSAAEQNPIASAQMVSSVKCQVSSGVSKVPVRGPQRHSDESSALCTDLATLACPYLGLGPRGECLQLPRCFYPGRHPIRGCDWADYDWESTGPLPWVVPVLPANTSRPSKAPTEAGMLLVQLRNCSPYQVICPYNLRNSTTILGS